MSQREGSSGAKNSTTSLGSLRGTNNASEGLVPQGAGTGRARLSREVVLEAALDIVDAGGVDALTMRGLGHRLGRDPMALYRYTENREALLDGITELILNQWIVSRVGQVHSWQEQLRHAAHDFRTLVLQHHHVVPLLVTRPLFTPMGLRPLGTLRPLEQILTILDTAGFGPVNALHAYRAYYGFLIGHILNEVERFVVNPDEDELRLRLDLHRLPEEDFPHLRRLAAMLSEYDGEAELNEGITIVLQGLKPNSSPRHQVSC